MVRSFWFFFGSLFPDFVLANRLVAEKRRIEKEEELAEEELLELQRQMSVLHQSVNERFARLARLRQQKRLVKTKGVDMIRRGLKSLDELEEVERCESEAVIDVQSSGGFGVVDWNAVGVLDDFLMPDLGVVDGTGVAAAGSSSNS